MNWVDLSSILLIAIGLSADCFAVSLSIGASGNGSNRKQVLKVALAFGLFQAGMPLIGWLAGQTVVSMISGYDHWLAFALLSLVGGKMIWECIRGETEGSTADISKLGVVVTLALATSIDALAVGLSFAFLQFNIIQACAIIGVVAFLITGTGFWLGKKASQLIGRWAELFGGLILIIIGLRILITHMVE